MNKHHIRRLRIAVTALYDAAKIKTLVEKFDMSRYGYMASYDSKGTDLLGCGTPACVLGHVGARRDLQSFLQLTTHGHVKYVRELAYSPREADYSDERLCKYYGITSAEAADLFGSNGCNDAKTPRAAAWFIEKFCRRKERKLERIY